MAVYRSYNKITLVTHKNSPKLKYCTLQEYVSVTPYTCTLSMRTVMRKVQKTHPNNLI